MRFGTRRQSEITPWGGASDWLDGRCDSWQNRHATATSSVTTSFSRDTLQSRHPLVVTSFSVETFLSGIKTKSTNRNMILSKDHNVGCRGTQHQGERDTQMKDSGEEGLGGRGSEWIAGYDKRWYWDQCSALGPEWHLPFTVCHRDDLSNLQYVVPTHYLIYSVTVVTI